MSNFIVKLNNRHKLFKALGMTHAWRFPDFSSNAATISEIEQYLRKTYGNQEWGWMYGVKNRWDFKQKWATHWSKPSKSQTRVYWIGIKEPEMAMMAALKGLPV